MDGEYLYAIQLVLFFIGLITESIISCNESVQNITWYTWIRWYPFPGVQWIC